MSGDILSKLMKVKNQGGFRYIGTITEKFDVKYVVLFITGSDKCWKDSIDTKTSILQYSGDNKIPGKDFHKTLLHGNEILRDSLFLADSKNIADRIKVPPFFVFAKEERMNVRFIGLAVPGVDGIEMNKCLNEIWESNIDGNKFQNYESKFTILNLEHENQSIDLKWLNDILIGESLNSIYVPNIWKNWIEKGNSNDICKNEKVSLDKSVHNEMISVLVDYFYGFDELFKQFAILVTILFDPNIGSYSGTNESSEGLMIVSGKYEVFKSFKTPVIIDFIMNIQKCTKKYQIEQNSINYEIVRLILQIRENDFGILFTLNYQNEVIDNLLFNEKQQIIIIQASDIVNMFNRIGIENSNSLVNWLKINCPK